MILINIMNHLQTYFLKSHFTIIHRLRPDIPRGHIPSGFPIQSYIFISVFFHACKISNKWQRNPKLHVVKFKQHSWDEHKSENLQTNLSENLMNNTKIRYKPTHKTLKTRFYFHFSRT
jgi:hypothetical protein